MSLPVILGALNLFPSSKQEDPEKAEDAEEAADDSHAVGADDGDVADADVEGEGGREFVGEDVDSEAGEDDEDNHDVPEAARSHRQDTLESEALRPSRRFPRILTGDTTFSRKRWTTRLKSLLFPSDENNVDVEKYIPNYRWSPILSGVVIPFSILLEIPGLTEHWYIRTEGNKTVEIRPNSVTLDVGLAFSMLCALCANIFLVLRFLEKRVKTVTLLTIFFLTIHDIINIICVTTFGVQNRHNDGFTYGQSFWLTICSTAASSVANITLVVDFVRTPSFVQSGSGLTRKQRALMIIVIALLVYIAFGALINSLILNLNFIDGLYFTVVTIETIGFGDIHPTSTGSRVFTCFYMVFGIINLGVAIAMTRETVLEGLHIGYRRRLQDLWMRRREARRFRSWQRRWRKAVQVQLQKQGLPVWVPDHQLPSEEVHFEGLPAPKEGAGEIPWMQRWLTNVGLKRRALNANRQIFRRGTHLNMDALSPHQLEAAALEAGVPLEMFLTTPRSCDKEDPSPTDSRSSETSSTVAPHDSSRAPGLQVSTATMWPSTSETPSHAQVGRMAAMLTKFAMAVAGAHAPTAVRSCDGRQVAEKGSFVEGCRASTQQREQTQGAYANDDPSAQFVVAAPQNPFPNGTSSGVEAAAADRPEEVSAEKTHPAGPHWLRNKSITFHEHLTEEFKNTEKRAHTMKVLAALALFLIFLLVGSTIFSKTEGWSYGIALYFCVIAFTTTGYGDYAPESPAGRSIFVVWSLLGVGTVTIFIAVIEEAGSSRYKRALHSKTFDSAVAKFREREDKRASKNTASHRPQLLMEHSSSKIDAAISAAHANAQRELEGLPEQIIRVTKTFGESVRYVANTNGQNISLADEAGGASKMPAQLKQLLDEIAQLENMSGRTKLDILEDTDSRNTLLTLSIERSLRTLIDSAERALAALGERDRLAEMQSRVARSQPSSTPSAPVSQEGRHNTQEQPAPDDTAL